MPLSWQVALILVVIGGIGACVVALDITLSVLVLFRMIFVLLFWPWLLRSRPRQPAPEATGACTPSSLGCAASGFAEILQKLHLYALPASAGGRAVGFTHSARRVGRRLGPRPGVCHRLGDGTRFRPAPPPPHLRHVDRLRAHPQRQCVGHARGVGRLLCPPGPAQGQSPQGHHRRGGDRRRVPAAATAFLGRQQSDRTVPVHRGELVDAPIPAPCGSTPTKPPGTGSPRTRCSAMAWTKSRAPSTSTSTLGFGLCPRTTSS